MGEMVLMTLLALPLVLLAARVGRRRWVRRSVRRRAELFRPELFRPELFRHRVLDEPSGRRLIRS
ncbi:hypothetical protein [Saccharothrix sp. Mg75]|uniref:hypothetical protein n=1 Tax=Saccharothrix sp. Mg75 TaxID=3445357 RepID=UPI003EECD386